MECSINNEMAAVEDSCTCIYNRLDFDRDSDRKYQENMSYEDNMYSDGKMVDVVTIRF